jgi:protein-disulfide isomerase
MNSFKAAHGVNLDKQLGKRIKVGGTPSYYVNGRRFDGRSAAALRAVIAEEIAKRKPGAEPSATPPAS